jgi:hypothetical protein
MAALTASAPLRVHGVPTTHKFILDTSAAQVTYKGAPLVVNQSIDATGPLVAHVDITHPEAVAADDVFMGIAAEDKSVAISDPETLASSGIECYVEPTVLGFKSTAFTQASAGLGAYMPDSATLAGVASVADCPYIGIVQFVEDGYVYVKLVTQVCTGA